MNSAAKEEFMDPLDAAYYMAITPELLFYYTSRGFKRSTGFEALPSHGQDGKTFFATKDLDAFDALLAGPWQHPPGEKAPVPGPVTNHLRAEALNQCARCKDGIGIQNAHIVPWNVSHSNHHRNLIRLCANCHKEYDVHHTISFAQIQELKKHLSERVRDSLRSRLQDVGVGSFRRPAPLFVGRSEELQTLIALLREGRSVMINAVGGGGKTELLVQALAVMETGRRVIWIDVDQYRSTAAVSTALRFALSKGRLRADDKIAELLDEADAILVLDGVERANLDDLDAFEDFVAELIRSTASTQFAITSQVPLPVLALDARIELPPLGNQASMAVLNAGAPSAGWGDEVEMLQLMNACEGHPLTLRIVNALLGYYRSARATKAAMDRSGARELQFPTRRRQDRSTSLDLCLAAAYEALEPNARNLLWSMANLPAGMFSEYIEAGTLGTDDPARALAELRRWHLVESFALAPGLDRIYMLRPVRSFAANRGAVEAPEAYAERVKSVVMSLQMQVAVLEIDTSMQGRDAHVLARYGDEIANLMNVLFLARSGPADAETVSAAISIAGALMRFFFVAGPYEEGVKVLLDAADLARSNALERKAASLALQAAALAQRDGSKQLLARVSSVLTQLEAETVDRAALVDLALGRATLHKAAGQDESARTLSFSAYLAHCSKLRELLAKRNGAELPKPDESELDEAHNDISNALNLLGFALLAEEEFARARKAYLHSLNHQRGSNIGVNRGQALHQLGNCESNLGNFPEAWSCYREAARHFSRIGMSGYLSNAVGEMGYALLDFPNWVPVELDLIEAGLVDLEQDMSRVLGVVEPLQAEDCLSMLRKVTGTFIVALLHGGAEAVALLCPRLHGDIVSPAFARMSANDSGSPETQYFLAKIHQVLMFGMMMADLDTAMRQVDGIPSRAVDELLQFAGETDGWSRANLRLADWISEFLTRRWGIVGADKEAIFEFVDLCGIMATEPLNLHRPPVQ